MPPPTRANSAIELAPRENPDNTGSTVALRISSVPPQIDTYTANRTDMPSNPRPTTLMPITEPPVNATINAGFKPLRALLAVREFAIVATRMPKMPARAEHTAPTRKDTPTYCRWPLFMK